MDSSSRTIPAAQFRDQCLRLVHGVRATGEKLIVTKHGRPVAAVVPYVEQSTASVIGWSDDIRIAWDPEEPAIPPGRWQVLSDPDEVLSGDPRGDEG
ncbi:MAG: type II toxin-antitoxin system Phd/YefM family antitoxin [bacterium]|nr:type II toxin-antitoxin system Phd/YefM family antitoxin [bacterium]